MALWLMHGLLGAIAVFIIYPLGILSRRLPSSRISHASAQSIGIGFTSIGGAIGLWQSAGISQLHQYLGLAMMFVIYCQFYTGHILREVDSNSNVKQYLRLTHTVQGFGSLAAGWYCFVTGLVLASWDTKVVAPLGLATLVEIVAIPTVYMLVLKKAGCTPVVDRSEMSMPGVEDNVGNEMMDESRNAFA